MNFRARAGPDDWEIWHHKGLSFTYLKVRHTAAPSSRHLPCHRPPLTEHPTPASLAQQFNDAIECFRHANECQPHDATFIQLGKVHVLMENFEAAIQVCKNNSTTAAAARMPGCLATSTAGTPCAAAGDTRSVAANESHNPGVPRGTGV